MALKNIIKNLFIYTEPKQENKFVLDENAFDKKMHQLHEKGTKRENIKLKQEEIGMQAEQEAEQQSKQQSQQQSQQQSKQQSDIQSEQQTEKQDKSASDAETPKHKTQKKIKNAHLLYDKSSLTPNEKNSKQDNKQKASEIKQASASTEKTKISSEIEVVKEYMKGIYNIPTNGDIIIREFCVILGDTAKDAFAIFFDGMVDRKLINDNILQPLMILVNIQKNTEEKSGADYIKKRLLPQNQLKEEEFYEDVIEAVNFGSCGIFVNGCEKCFVADVKGWEHRNVEKSNNEIVLRGPQEGFNEILRVNTALIRKILVDEKLIVEDIKIGKRGKKACSMLYISDIANESLVSEVRRRLNNIKVDYLIDAGELEQLIEDSSFLGMPQMLATERPDRTAYALTEGRVAVLVNGSPQSLIMPNTILSMMSSVEDEYLRFPYSNFIKIIRILAILIALLLPGLYIATTNFHPEMIPSSLLIAIEASREKVPFPTIVEILTMEISFELIREAGVRIPGPIGPTLGIIGALILGQAAVAANIVSPILIIIVAVTGIGSFAVPNFNVAFGLRILKFVYIIMGATAGFLGILTAAFIHLLLIAGAKSFGVPFMSPAGPATADKSYFKGTYWQDERRPDYLNTKADIKQENISRRWKG